MTDGGNGGFVDLSTGKPLTQAQLDEMRVKIDKVRDDIRAGRAEKKMGPQVADPYDVREVERDQQKGWERKPELWEQVMKYHGFTWYEARDLDAHPLVGPQKYIPTDPKMRGYFQLRPNPEGQWRNDLKNPRLPEQLKQAFTVKDLITGFGPPPKGPEVFDNWMKDYRLKFRAAQAGIVIARGRR